MPGHMNRAHRANLARETLSIIEQGGYTAPSGNSVVLGDAIATMLQGTHVYAPEELGALPASPQAPALDTRLTVTNETTLAAAARLLRESDEPVLALNFASAKNPGGGFLAGSQAQEESLARSSAVYTSLLQGEQMYQVNRACHTCLYTDFMVYSPSVPVFRADSGQLLESPYRVSMLTAPAANAGALKEHERPLLESVMTKRAGLVLAVARARGYARLVLGAWGCGVFRNDPERVASWFATHLQGSFAGAFSEVVFAVYDTSESRTTLRAFERAFRIGLTG